MGDLYRKERRGRKVSYQEYGQQMVVGSLRSHLEMQHDVYTSFALPTDALLQWLRGDSRRRTTS